jgi:hypothetical protein
MDAGGLDADHERLGDLAVGVAAAMRVRSPPRAVSPSSMSRPPRWLISPRRPRHPPVPDYAGRDIRRVRVEPAPPLSDHDCDTPSAATGTVGPGGRFRPGGGRYPRGPLDRRARRVVPMHEHSLPHPPNDPTALSALQQCRGAFDR